MTTRPRPDGAVTMAHGAGGRVSRRLTTEVALPHLSNPLLDRLADAAVVEGPGGSLAVTTDGFVVQPLRFPGGSIGSLAVHGTCNDLAVVGARPLALTAAFVAEEGLALADLDAEFEAMGAAARAAGVPVAAADTKVVERGRGDGLVVVTSGVGRVVSPHPLEVSAIRSGDVVVVSGPVGDHGTAVLLAREDLGIDAELRSDAGPVWPLVEPLVTGPRPIGGLRCLRDPTRGGLATVLCEFAADSGTSITLDEAAVPVRPEVRGVCELLGLDPLYVACEGRVVAVVAPGDADELLSRWRTVPAGRGAAVIGGVGAEPAGRVVGRTAAGGERLVELLAGDPLPRIC